MTSSDAIRTHREFLEERMDPDFGLLDKLREREIMGWKEIDDIMSEITTWKRNSKLLNDILAKDQSDALIVALRDADQKHIVNYLTANGEYSVELGGEWPLKKREISILNTNHGSLVDLLELTDLLGLLYCAKVINRRQMDTISSKPTSHQKNDTLLNILRRRSLRDYQQTINCLHKSQQGHITEILDSGGVLVRAHASLDGDDVTKTENDISTAIANTIINNRPAEEASRILELVNLKVIAAKKGQSIVLYIYCKTIEDLEQLQQLLFAGRLKESIELWFNRLLTRSKKITVSAITVSDEELQNMRTYFTDNIRISVRIDEETKSIVISKNAKVDELFNNVKQAFGFNGDCKLDAICNGKVFGEDQKKKRPKLEEKEDIATLQIQHNADIIIQTDSFQISVQYGNVVKVILIRKNAKVEELFNHLRQSFPEININCELDAVCNGRVIQKEEKSDIETLGIRRKDTVYIRTDSLRISVRIDGNMPRFFSIRKDATVSELFKHFKQSIGNIGNNFSAVHEGRMLAGNEGGNIGTLGIRDLSTLDLVVEIYGG